MQFDIAESEINQAKYPHNLLISGMFAFNLFAVPLVISFHIGMLGLLIPFFCSAILVSFIYIKGKKVSSSFVAAHWRLSFLNSKWLFIGYAATSILVCIAWLVSLTAHEASMKVILWTALTRIGLLPTLIAVMVTAMMEANAISQATNRELPDYLATKIL
jgi:membrane-associated HD superfamily phosphohydrolase